ncbi:hypothetical protein MTP99_018885 [Tenebrio molitor]|nr:hypothetical protein MTP99_018885 [Tenebrio molitor]
MITQVTRLYSSPSSSNGPWKIYNADSFNGNSQRAIPNYIYYCFVLFIGRYSGPSRIWTPIHSTKLCPIAKNCLYAGF